MDKYFNINSNGTNSSGAGSSDRPMFASSNTQNGLGNTSITSSSTGSSGNSSTVNQPGITTKDIVKTLASVNRAIDKHSNDGLRGNASSIKLGLLALQLSILDL